MKTYETPIDHEWAGLQALDTWIVAENTGFIARTRQGIVIPDQSRMAVWIAYSVGEKCTRVAKGDRIIFMVPNGPVTIDGRIFLVIREADVMARLPMVLEASEPVENIVPGPAPAPVAQINGKGRILVPKQS